MNRRRYTSSSERTVSAAGPTHLISSFSSRVGCRGRVAHHVPLEQGRATAARERHLCREALGVVGPHGDARDADHCGGGHGRGAALGGVRRGRRRQRLPRGPVLVREHCRHHQHRAGVDGMLAVAGRLREPGCPTDSLQSIGKILPKKRRWQIFQSAGEAFLRLEFRPRVASCTWRPTPARRPPFVSQPSPA